MSGTPGIKSCAKTTCLSVVASSHAAVDIVTDATNEQCNFAAVLNTGAATVCIVFSQNGDAAVLPVDGTPSNGYVLPPLMVHPLVLSIPSLNKCKVTAIATAAGPSLVYITPLSYI